MDSVAVKRAPAAPAMAGLPVRLQHETRRTRPTSSPSSTPMLLERLREYEERRPICETTLTELKSASARVASLLRES